MVGYDRQAECLKAARAIAMEADALPHGDQHESYFAAHPHLDNELLAYSIGADRVRSHVIPFSWEEMMPAIERVIEDAWSSELNPLALSA